MNYETTWETLLCEVNEQIATITLNRPKVLNALNARVFDELEAVFTALSNDPSVRVVLLTGSVPSALDRDSATQVVQNVSGVTSVRNKLKVASQ